MKNIFYALIILAHFSTVAQSIEKSKINLIDSLFSEYDKSNSPGCVLGLIKDGNFIYQRGYGSANLENNIPISSNTVFDIGSMSKQFTSAAIILLQQQGKLSLDDSVRKYIPELPWYGKTMTIRQMLNHTSGLRDYNSLLTLSGKQEEQVTTKEDALNIIIKQKNLNFNIGEEWDYSNTGFFLASVIVERISGLSMKEFSEKNIFKPLGMKNTFYLDNHTTIVPYRATAYAPNEVGGFQINMSNWEQTGDGAIQTNCNDLSLWDKNYYNPIVGGQDFLKLITTTSTLNNGEKLNYTLGLFKEEFYGLELFHHGGAWAGYRAELLRFPQEHFSVICLSNLASFNPSGLAREVAKIYLTDKLKKENKVEITKSVKSTKPLNKESVQSYSGHYHTTYNDILREVSVEGDKLFYVRNSSNKTELIYIGNDEFIIKDNGFHMKFIRSKNNEISAINVLAGGVKPITLNRYTPAKFLKTNFLNISGNYYSDELNRNCEINLSDSSLIAIIDKQDSISMSPVTKDSFVDESHSISIEFNRNQNGKVDGFYITVSRVRKIFFKRI